MRFCVLAVLLLTTLTFPVYAEMTESDSQGYGFWEIGVSNFTADTPIVVRSPFTDDNSYYYVWPLTFKNTISLNRVLQDMKTRLRNAGENAEQKDLLTRCIARVTAEVERKHEPFRLYISLHTDTGKVYHDLSDSVVRDLAQRKLRYHYYTTAELAKADLKPDEIVRVVAIFPEIDKTCDAFEMQILGLGSRIGPSYFPGNLINLASRHEPRLRKALRYFYKRPGDPLRRESDIIIFDSHKEEWLWMWSTDIYPQQSQQFFVERSQGLRYEYRYFPYEIFNSTPEEQEIKVLKAGLSPNIKWHGIPLSLEMSEEVGTDLVLDKQALASLREDQPELFAALTDRHVNTTLQPGKKAAGLAIIRWGVEDVESLLKNVIINLHLNGITSATENQDDPLFNSYLELIGESKDSEWHYPPLPEESALKEIILEQARNELEDLGIEISAADQRRYEGLAPFAVLMNTLADQENQKLEESNRIPVSFTVAMMKVIDNARSTNRFDLPSPEEKDIIVDVKIIDPEYLVIEESKPIKRTVVTPSPTVTFDDTEFTTEETTEEITEEITEETTEETTEGVTVDFDDEDEDW